MPETVDARAIIGDRELLITARLILNALAQAKGAGADEVEVNVSRSIQAMMFAAALLLDVDPEPRTPRDLRLTADEAGKLLHQLLRALNFIKEQTGAPMLSQMGSVKNPTYHEPDPAPVKH